MIPTNFKGYAFLQGAEQLRLSPNQPVRSRTDYMLWQAYVVSSKGGNTWDSPEPIYAIVNHGRWIAKCRWCDSGMYTHPKWKVAFCAECGARYREGKVVFPAEAEKIEKLLCRRIRRDQQNWEPPQSVEDLVDENRKLGYR